MRFGAASGAGARSGPQSGHAFGSVAAHPLGGGLLADVKADRGLLHGRLLNNNSSGQLFSQRNGKSGILVIVHSVSPGTLIRRRTSFSQSDRMDNLLKLHS
jgi:hypothetical protein